VTNIDKFELYRKRRGDSTGYALFIEFGGRRYLKLWTLTDAAEVDPIDVVDIMIENVHEEVKQKDFDPKIGSPVENMLPEWLHEGWIKVDLDNV
jgi:hypothetical protein